MKHDFFLIVTAAFLVVVAQAQIRRRATTTPAPAPTDYYYEYETDPPTTTTTAAPTRRRRTTTITAQGTAATRGSGRSLIGKIVGGTQADRYEFPWMVRLQIFYPGDRNAKRSCGGSLISKQWVLTAAHCVREDDNPDMKPTVIAFIGEYDTSRNNEDYEQSSPVAEVYVHPNYTKTNPPYNNDFALLKLNAPMVFNKAIGPIILADQLGFCGTAYNQQTLNVDSCSTREVWAAGWGMNGTDIASTYLKKLKLMVKPYRECEVFLGDSAAFSHAKICAGSDQRAQDTCPGDSGGPLMCRGRDGLFFQLGLTSYGEGSCSTVSAVPSIYSRICSGASWIRSYVPVNSTSNCALPPVIRNGKALPGSSVVGSVRRVECDQGYVIKGSDVAYCNSVWTFSGTCVQVANCIVPEVQNGKFFPSAVDNGDLDYPNGSRVVATTVVYLRCDIGFRFMGENSASKCETTKQLRPVPGRCIPIVQDLSITNVAANGTVAQLQRILQQTNLADVNINAQDDARIFTCPSTGQRVQRGTVLHVATACNQTLDFVRELHDNGAVINANESLQGWYPLHYAAWNGNRPVCEYLVGSGGLVDVRSSTGATPLMLAASSGSLETAKLLVALRANVNVVNADGETALMFAARAGKLDVVRYLVDQARASINVADLATGTTALGYAQNFQRVEVVAYLISKKAV